MSGINITIGNWTHTTGFDSPLSFMIGYHLFIFMIYTLIYFFAIHDWCDLDGREYNNKKIDYLEWKLNRREQCMSEISDKIEQLKLE